MGIGQGQGQGQGLPWEATEKLAHNPPAVGGGGLRLNTRKSKDESHKWRSRAKQRKGG